MFEQLYNDIKEGYKQSWFRFFFKYTALGKLLDQSEQINASDFFNTYLSSWWWNRLWFRACIQHKSNLSEFDIILDSLSILKKSEILTEESRALVAKHTQPEILASGLKYLQRQGILTDANFALVAKHTDPLSLASALHYLHLDGISTEENRTLVAEHADPLSLAFALHYLHLHGISTEENRTLVSEHAAPLSLFSALHYLHLNEISTEENRTLIAQYAHFDTLSLAFALNRLQRSGISTEENRALVAKHASPSHLASALDHLQCAGILTEENRALVAKHAHPEILASALDKLTYTRILTQANFDALVAENHVALVLEEAAQCIWSRIPAHLLTQANFERLVTASEHAYPIAEIRRALHRILGVPTEHAAAFNQAQSTHTASVHRSVSESAARLMKSYGTGLNLEDKIQKIKAYMQGLDNSLKHLAAKRCIERITSSDYTFTDSSGVTTRQLLTLAYTAIHDKTKRQGSLEDALALFVEGLYEIQRGYNLNEEGVDDQSPFDIPICSAGTFNKLMEKLNGVHSEVEIYFITHEGLCFKFPKVVEECALNYLNRLASPKTEHNYLSIKKLLDSVKDSGLEPIWDKIQSEVEAKLWDEFKKAYSNKPENSKFRTMIAHGHDSNAPDLTELYSRLEASPGYQAFLYQLEQKSLGQHKLCLRLHQHSLWANRHQSPENQHAFDKQYGLILKP